MTVRVLQGNAPDVLAGIAEEHFHCVVTSIPYWMLRDYGTPPQVWPNPDGTPLCDRHLWETEVYYREGGNSGSSALAFSEAGPENAQRLKDTRWKESNFCVACGAWRGEWGQEQTPELYVEHTVYVMRGVKRTLRKDGTLWLNIGDSYASTPPGNTKTGVEKWASSGLHGQVSAKYAATLDASVSTKRNTIAPGLKPKDLCLIPFRLALALQADGWYVRSDIAWCKRAPMPESVTDRPTNAWEHIFLLTKSERYFYDADAVREKASDNTHARGNGSTPKGELEAATTGRHAGFYASTTAVLPTRNMWSYWLLSPEPFPEAHFATFPTEIPERAIKAGTSEKGACPTCGAPWRRVTEKVPTGETQKMADGWDAGPGGHGTIHRNGREKGEAGKPVLATSTVGWEPTCKCDPLEPVPCVVLDICFGSGTTGVVASRLGLECIGIELNPEYAEMARRRVTNDSPLFAEVELIASGTGARLADGPPVASANGTPTYVSSRLPLEESA